MKKPLRQGVRVTAIALALAAVVHSPASAQRTAFTYQGSLDDAGSPASGLHDLRFGLFDVASGSVPIDATVCVDDVNVVAGVFTVELDFGPQFSIPDDRYLEIEVRRDTGLTCANGAGFVILAPRQKLTAAPIASHANSAFALDAPDGAPAKAVYVDNAGKVGLGTTSPATQLHVQSTGPVMILQDLASAANQAGYLGFWNNVSAETGWVGFGSPGSPHFTILNARSGGDVLVWAGGGPVLTARSTGRVGIGTTTPGAKLDVRGDINLGPTGALQATSGEEKLRIIRGRVLANGNMSVGSGYTSSRTSTGTYVITFTTPFTTTPTMTVSADVAMISPPIVAMTNGVFTTSGGVKLITGGGTSIDENFQFIAIGPR